MLFLLFAIMCFLGLARADVVVPWENCNKASPLQLTQLTSNVWPPKSGQPLSLTMNLASSVIIDGTGQCEIKIKALGITVFHKKLGMDEAFKAMNMTTPVAPSSWVWNYDTTMPHTKSPKVTLVITMNQNSGDLLCVKLKAGIKSFDATSEAAGVFTQWMKEHGRTYETQEMLLSRYETFKTKYEMIHNHNQKNLPYTLGMNQFSDMTSGEVASKMNGYVAEEQTFSEYFGEYFTHDATKETPKEVDWRKEGAVTPVKDQGQCGSCWSFSTTGAVEGINFIKTGKLVSFSEQEIVDCDKTFLTQGCQGGSMGMAMRWTKKQKGLCTEADYPYEGVDGKCRKSSCTNAGGALTGLTKVAPNDANALMQAVAQQPVSIAIEADQASFQHYKSGVFTGPCGAQLDHGVLLVGYGTTDDGQDYWIVKNSWATTYGEDGYIRIARGSNLCGILNQPIMPNM